MFPWSLAITAIIWSPPPLPPAAFCTCTYTPKKNMIIYQRFRHKHFSKVYSEDNTCVLRMTAADFFGLLAAFAGKVTGVAAFKALFSFQALE
jgi:hypothetical protein